MTQGSDQRPDRNDAPGDGDLAGRLERLDREIEKRGSSESAGAGGRSGGDASSGLAQAFRLSSEFVAGVVAGGIVGFLVDKLFGSSPWGLIVFLLLGFAAGVLNVMRSAGLVKGPGQ